MTRISFIMPTFNRADYIAQSLDAVLAQMSPDDELVVVDDGSFDGTEEAVKPYLGRLRYLRQDNAGKSVALNRAMEVTGGEYVWICDDDDLLRPGVVARMVSEIESAGVDMVFGRYTRFRIEDGARVEMGAGYWPDLGRGSVARHILEDAFVMHNASLVRRAAYDRLGPFDPRMLRSQDYEMFVRLALRATIRFVDTVVFDQRKHE
ncbi:MAG: glycosyltransferase family 2 protein, partial [Pseudomonadota bacterium]